MAMTRSLGEGKIYKMTKKSAYIQDERLGSVYFPIAACVSSDCYDLRDKFQADEVVIFTAQKQQNIQNDSCRYVASSVVKKKELISCNGRIAETCEKFCYAEVKKFGKVFVPYSARNESNKAWLGKGAEQGRSCQLKIFRQPDINQCRYVAFGITVDDSSGEENGGLNKTNGQLKGAEKQPDTANEQIGVIVSLPSQGDCLVYSAQTGLARLPASERQKWMKLGRFMQYDIIKQPDPNCKVSWLIRNFKDFGTLFKVVEDYMDESKLHLEVPAVVNRVSTSSRAAWLWNDLIGRIYIPSSCFSRGLHAFASVRIRALYTGAFEDVPWSALSIEVLGDDDDTRKANSQLLITDDNWVVKFIQSQAQTFFGFMDNPKFGSAFIAWTDLTEGDTPPQQGTMCRATVYHQQRDRKHAWRAVMVTPLETSENGSKPVTRHPKHEHTGRLRLPTPIEAPVRITPPPGPIQSHASRLGRQTSAVLGSSGLAPTMPAPIGSSLGGGAPGPIGSHSHTTLDRHPSFDSIFSPLYNIPPPGLPPKCSFQQNGSSIASSLTPPPSSESPPTLRSSIVPLDSPSDLQSRSGSVQSQQAFGADFNNLPYFNSIFSLGQQDFLPWCPPLSSQSTDSSTPASSTPLPLVASSNSTLSGCGGLLRLSSNGNMNGHNDPCIGKTAKSAGIEQRDAETQTEQLAEQLLIKEMMQNKQFRNEVYQHFRLYFDKLMDLQFK